MLFIDVYKRQAVTFAILVFSEISPKVIAAAHAEKLGILCSYILYPLLKVLYPVVWFVNLFVEGLLKILGVNVNFNETSQSLTMDELRSIVTDAGNFLPKKHRTILLNLFELEKISVDDVMTAHTLVAVSYTHLDVYKRQGLGFPIARIGALIGLSSGAILSYEVAACEGKGTGEQSLLMNLADHLNADDVLLADALLATWWIIERAIERGADVVMAPVSYTHLDVYKRQEHF